jgi:four helix bundle protein
MDPLSLTEVAGVEQRLRAFRAADAFVVEAFRIASTLEGGAGRDLASEVRRALARCGAALVAASVAGNGGAGEIRCLEEARTSLAEGRYYLYLARRLGFIDVRQYRSLMTRQDAAAREVDVAARAPEPRPGPRSRDPT